MIQIKTNVPNVFKKDLSILLANYVPLNVVSVIPFRYALLVNSFTL